jgi:hypothetical protein
VDVLWNRDFFMTLYRGKNYAISPHLLGKNLRRNWNQNTEANVCPVNKVIRVFLKFSPPHPPLSTSLSGPILTLHSLSSALLILDPPTVRSTLTPLLYRLPGLQIADITIVATTGLFENETDILKVFSRRTYLTCVYTGLFLWVSISEYLKEGIHAFWRIHKGMQPRFHSDIHIHVARSFVFCVMFCRSLFVLLSLFFW